MSDLKAILFDLDNTLLDRNQSLKNFLADQYSRFTQLQTVDEQAFTEEFIALDDNGKVWKDIVYSKIIEKFKVTGITANELLQDYITNFRNHTILFPDVLDALNELKKNQDLKLGIITNGPTELQASAIRNSNLEKFMDVILISEKEGVKKPDPKIFEKALDALTMSAHQCLFIGDNPIADIEGAYDIGMKTIWFENSYFEKPSQELLYGTLTDYKNLPKLINDYIGSC